MSTAAVAALLFGSGFCALAYQTTWLREFRLIFGASTAASAAVLAVFMGGLGAGGALLGSRADRSGNGLRFYALLELGIALSAAATPFLLLLARAAYIASGGSVAFGTAGATAVRLLLTALVLGVPTVLMGGTLPAAARAVERSEDRGRRSLAALYGMNTVGAVTGALAGTFGMLETFGNRATLWSAAVVNVAIALAALAMARRAREEAPDAAGSVAPRRAGRRRRGFVFGAAAIVGFAFFLMEIVWYRMLAPLLGGSTYTFGLILAVALAGIGAGGLLYSVAGRSRPATLRAFAITCAAESLLVALPFAAGDRMAIFALVARGLGSTGFEGLVAGWIGVAALVVFPAAAVAGFQFPLLVGLLGEGRDEVGRDAGLAYAWNTAGAIAGSLAGGFGILPLLGAPGAWSAVAILLAALAWAAIVLAWIDEDAGASLAIPALIGAAALACFAAQGPTAVWRHTPIGAGRAELQTSDRAWRSWMHEQRRSILWELDGIESSVALTQAAGMAFLVNGKSDGHFRSDAGTQVMVGMIGAALHPDPRRAFVIGLGSGSTAGWLARIPGIERVDVAELEPGIVRVARHASPVNGGALENPRLRIRFGDARELLLTSKERYDVIVSEPSNPYRAGVASLFTREFYEAVSQRLNPGGIFVQWVQTYEIEAGTIRSVYATLSSVFEDVESWQSQPTDLVLVSSNGGRRLDAARLRALVESPPFADAMHAAWRTETLEGFLARFVAGDAFARVLVGKAGPRINSDDRNFLEFEAARSVGGDASFDIGELRAAAIEGGHHRPVIAGAVDWDRVELERLGVHSSNEDAPPSPPGGSPELQARARAHSEWVKGRLDGALGEWRGCCHAVVNSLEIAMVAEMEAEAQEATAEAWLDALALEQPVESDLMRARLRWRQNRLEETTALLERGYVANRTDPWPLGDVVARSLSIAEFTAAERPDLAPRIHRALERPFAILAIDEQRRRTLLSIAQRMERACGEKTLAAIRSFEPWVPWEKHFLTVRAECYEAARDPRAARARTQLDELLADEPEPLMQ